VIAAKVKLAILSSKPSMLQIRHHGGCSFDFGICTCTKYGLLLLTSL
jgi:hypothetical protein